MIRYALVDGIRMDPAYGLQGFCPTCGNFLRAKCGSIKIHHWAHASRQDCDPWWENITQWHLDWQNQFPESWREVVLHDRMKNESHRADIHTPEGITIEFQHSSISSEEMQSRNNFYTQLVWVIDAKRFKDNVKLLKSIPNPEMSSLSDYDFNTDHNGFANYDLYMIKEDVKINQALVRMYDLQNPELKAVSDIFAKQNHTYWLFKWHYKHVGWINSTAPVFLDFGDDSLYWIKRREQILNPLIYLKMIRKKDFLNKYGGKNEPN